MLGFAVRWLLVSVFWLIFVFTDIVILPNCGIPYLYYAVVFMGLANCTINPCICFIFNGNYRKQLIQSLVLIAMDRFGAVVFPLRSPLISSKLCPFFILATWIVAIAVNSPELVVRKFVEYPEGLFCEHHWNKIVGEFSYYENYIISYIVVFIFIPLVLIAILYITIYLKLKSQKIPGEQLANAEQKRQQREKNVLKMANAVVVRFAVCWLPDSVLRFIFFFTDTIIWPNCGVPHLYYVVSFMSLANCAITLAFVLFSTEIIVKNLALSLDK